MKLKNNILNLFIKIYFYLTRGVDVVNTFRNPALLIFGFIWTFKQKYPVLEDIRCITIIAIGSVIFMIILGALMVHVVGKVIDYLNVEHSTYWSKYGYKLQEDILSQLKKMNGDKDI